MTSENKKTIEILVSEDIKSSCPNFVGVAVSATVRNSSHNSQLWDKIDEFIREYKKNHKVEDIRKNKAIETTREAYKTLGKDPNRYRPSSESLCRRILKEQSLYNVNTLVDSINLVSMTSGYSIGGFDRNKIQGNVLTLGVGKENEPYEGIGKGVLNIHYLPVYRDSEGGIGTPTSDNERTKIDLDTKKILTIINSYSGKEGLQDAVDMMIEVLKEYVNAEDIDYFYFQ